MPKPAFQSNQPLFVNSQQPFSYNPIADNNVAAKDAARTALHASTALTNGLGLHGAVDTLGANLATMAHPQLASQGYIQTPSLKDDAIAGAQIAGAVIGNKGIGGTAKFFMRPGATTAVSHLSPQLTQAIHTGEKLAPALQKLDLAHIEQYLHAAQFGDINTFAQAKNKVLPLLKVLDIHNAPAPRQVKELVKLLENRPQPRDLGGRYLTK